MERDIIGWSWQDWLPHVIESIEQGDFEMSEQFYQGEPVWWEDQLFLTGYTGAPVKAIFVMKRKAKVKDTGIAVLMRSGEWRPKWVAARNVKARSV
jgi:hypothetical protein